MKLYYRILDIHEDEGSMLIRVYSDQFSEYDLRVNPNDTTNPPTRCRTDFNLNIWNPSWNKDELHAHIQQHINYHWFNLKHKIKDPAIDTSFMAAKSLMGKPFAVDWVEPTQTEEKDISHLLKDNV